MPQIRRMGSLSPADQARVRASNQKHAEFWKLPGEGRPATTTGPSIRNAVHNVKSIPGDFAEVGKKIGSGLKHAVQSFRTPPASTRGRFRGGRGGTRGGAMNKALNARTK